MLIIKKSGLSPERARHLTIRGGIKVLVSACDYVWLNSFNWFLLKSAASSYVVTRKIVNGKAHTVRMHRLVMQCPDWLKVHHVNHDTLDNRRENLQVITEREHRHFDGWHIFER